MKKLPFIIILLCIITTIGGCETNNPINQDETNETTRSVNPGNDKNDENTITVSADTVWVEGIYVDY